MMLGTELLVIGGLILLNGFFALAELALVSARRARLQARAERGSRGARSALALLEDPTGLLSSVQIGVSLISILSGVYSGAVFAAPLARHFAKHAWLAPHAENAAFACVVLAVTCVSLVIGELVPKRIALSRAEPLAIAVAPVMQLFARATAPFVWVLRISTEAVLRLLPGQAAPQSAVTEDEVRALIAEATQSGVFYAKEKRLIEGVIALADRKVESVMVPRREVVWLDLDEPPEVLWQQARRSGHARFLAAHGDLEQLAGMITLATLSEALHRGRIDEQHDLDAPVHVPDTLTVLQLLEQFQRSSTHLAVITDEYGSIEGIATPVDVLRAIAGELPAVGSRERPEIVRREDGSLLVDGHLPAAELELSLGRRDLSSLDYHTVAGFVLAKLGRVPKTGESLTWRDLQIEVLDMDGLRIDKLLVTRRTDPRSGPGAAA
ncbi:MAG: HlyC/CorC family transporter [Gammaproteobacteria bacterium]|nr:HlyC/CorC family transporter [Gammaproteobacteria bacterium]